MRQEAANMLYDDLPELIAVTELPSLDRVFIFWERNPSPYGRYILQLGLKNNAHTG